MSPYSRSFMPKLVLYISRPFSKFTVDLSQESVLIDRFHRIDPTKTYNLFAPTLVTSASHKITAKCCILCPKTLLLPEKQPYAIHFFVATSNVCPLAIPESCAQNIGIRLLENHSFRSCTGWRNRTITIDLSIYKLYQVDLKARLSRT